MQSIEEIKEQLCEECPLHNQKCNLIHFECGRLSLVEKAINILQKEISIDLISEYDQGYDQGYRDGIMQML